MALRDCWRGGRVDVFTVNVYCVGDEGGAPIAALGVTLLEAEQLDLLGDEVNDVDHCGGWVVLESGRLFLERCAMTQRGIGELNATAARMSFHKGSRRQPEVDNRNVVI